MNFDRVKMIFFFIPKSIVLKEFCWHELSLPRLRQYLQNGPMSLALFYGNALVLLRQMCPALFLSEDISDLFPVQNQKLNCVLTMTAVTRCDRY